MVDASTQPQANDEAPVNPLLKIAQEEYRYVGDDEPQESDQSSVDEPSEEKPEFTPEDSTPVSEGDVEDAEAQEEGDGADPQEQDDENTTTSFTINDLAEANGWTQEDVDHIQIPFTVDGVTTLKPLGEVVKAHQIDQAAENRLEEARKKAELVDSKLAEQEAQFQDHLAQVLQLVQIQENRLKSKTPSEEELAELRQTDPSEYSAIMFDIQRETQEINQTKQDAAVLLQQVTQRNQAEQEEALRKQSTEESERLLTVFPEWRESEKASEGLNRLSGYLVNDMGFSEGDVAQAVDHRLFVMAEKARRWDEFEKSGGVARKKLAPLPKVIKPGVRVPPETKAAKTAAQHKRRLMQRGSQADAVAFLNAQNGT